MRGYSRCSHVCHTDCVSCVAGEADSEETGEESWGSGAAMHRAICGVRASGGIPRPATYCNHEYILVEAEPADCESGGFETYQCSLCGKNKTEKIEKLGHNMADVRRVEPTYDEDGEYVRRCTRCGYEEIEVLQKIELPTSTTELNKKSKPEIEENHPKALEPFLIRM